MKMDDVLQIIIITAVSNNVSSLPQHWCFPFWSSVNQSVNQSTIICVAPPSYREWPRAYTTK